MAVRIRMKRLGRRHRPFFRVIAVDGRTPRDGRVIEELGHYDPMVDETDARAVLDGERIDYWLSVGAQPSDNVKVLIKKYGSNGTHLDAQKAALDRLALSKPAAPPPVAIPLPKKEEEAAAEATEEAAAEAPAEATAETPSSETAETAVAETAEAPAEAAPAEAAAAEETADAPDKEAGEKSSD